MTGKKFMNLLANAKEDILQLFLDILGKTRATYCAVGGLAVNAYAEPVVSLDLGFVVIPCHIAISISSASGEKLISSSTGSR
jgi:hypothetical protein